MDQNTALLLGGLVVALIVALLVMRRRPPRKVKIPMGPLGNAELDATGATITGNELDGEKHTVKAQGPNADISDNVIKGTGHNIQAGP